MYNRYIPQSANYGPIPSEGRGFSGAQSNPRGSGSVHARPGGGLGSLFSGLLHDGGGESSALSQSLASLLKSFHLEDLDAGDILLAMIVLFLILEDGDNLDLIITLGLMILFSLGEQSCEEPSHQAG